MRTTKKQLAEQYTILETYREWLVEKKDTEWLIQYLNKREKATEEEIQKEINRDTINEWEERIKKEIQNFMLPSYNDDVPASIRKINQDIERLYKRSGKEQDAINKTHIKAVSDKLHEVVSKHFHIDDIGHSVVSMHYKKAFWYGKLTLRCNNYHQEEGLTYAVGVGDRELDNSIYPNQREAMEQSFEAALTLYRRPDIINQVSDLLLTRCTMLDSVEKRTEEDVKNLYEKATQILNETATKFYNSIKDRIQ